MLGSTPLESLTRRRFPGLLALSLSLAAAVVYPVERDRASLRRELRRVYLPLETYLREKQSRRRANRIARAVKWCERVYGFARASFYTSLLARNFRFRVRRADKYLTNRFYISRGLGIKLLARYAMRSFH